MDLFAYARTLEDRLEIDHYYTMNGTGDSSESRVPGLYRVNSTREEVLDSFGYTDAIVCRLVTLSHISGDASESFPVPEYDGGVVREDSAEDDLLAWIDVLERRLCIHEVPLEDGTSRPTTRQERDGILGKSDAVAILDAMIEEIEGPRRKRVLF